MKQRYKWLCLLPLILLAACASMFDKPPAGANYGPMPKDYEKEIARHIGVPVENIACEAPRRAYRTDGLINGGKVGWYGYAVRVRRASRNPLSGVLESGILMGALMKKIDSVALYDDGKLVAVLDMAPIAQTFFWVDK